MIRKPKPADPLVPRKKPPPRRQNAPQRPAPQKRSEPLQRPALANTGPQQATSTQALNGVKTNGGWSQVPTGPYQDFPLFTTKRALREGLRYHIARFSSKKDIDPMNQDEFTRPISLHRRDPRQPVSGKGVKEDEVMADEPIDSKEKEKQEILKAEREARRAADLAQIAPTGNNASAMAAKKSQAFRN